MAEVKAIPKWIMLEALRNNVSFLALEKSGGAITGSAPVSPAEFDIDTAVAEPVLRLSSETTKTLQVDAGDTIMAIVLWIDDTNAPAAYEDDEIRYPIGGVDGETFPDGGSIDTTEFEVYLNDL